MKDLSVLNQTKFEIFTLQKSFCCQPRERNIYHVYIESKRFAHEASSVVKDKTKTGGLILDWPLTIESLIACTKDLEPMSM